MVPPLPELSAEARRARRPRARPAGGGAGLRLHARWTARDDRRLPRGAAGERGAHPAPGRRGPDGDRAVADARRRVPRLGRGDHPEPGAWAAARRGARGRDAGRLPAGHVRARRADAADPATGRDRARGGLARRSGRRRQARVHVGGAGRLGSARGVPARGLQQRRLPAHRARRIAKSCRGAARGDGAVLRRRSDPRDVRDRPPGTAAGARRARTRGRDRDQDTPRIPGRCERSRASSLAGRAAFRRAGEPADGRHVSPDRPEDRRGPGRASARALRRAAAGPLVGDLARAAPRPGLEPHPRELGARLDLRLLRRRGLGAGARPVRGGAADRRGAGAGSGRARRRSRCRAAPSPS